MPATKKVGTARGRDDSKYQHPKEVKAHKPKLEPKSKLPKGYKHPVSHPKGAEILAPSDFGKARDKEMADAQPEAQGAHAAKKK